MANSNRTTLLLPIPELSVVGNMVQARTIRAQPSHVLTQPSQLGTAVGGISRTAGGLVGTAGRGVGQTINNTTGTKAVGDGLQGLTNGIEDGVANVARGVEDGSKGKKIW